MVADRIQKLITDIALYDDALAYKELFLSYHSKLVNFSSSITHSKQSAEEVVSDVFIKIWMHRNTLLRIDNFHLYIYIITKNLSINRLLRDKKQRSFSLDEALVNLESMSFNPELMMVSSESSKQIQAAIQELPVKCRLIFKLIKEDGLSYKETAELLELSLKTVENQMTIAFRKLGESIPQELHKSRLQ
jgi:RNA polymerase sigma-70 factor (family 1)